MTLKNFSTNMLALLIVKKIFLEVPVLPTVVARVTFQDFNWKNDFFDEFFTVPSDYIVSF